MVSFHEVSVWYSSSQRRTSRPFLWFSVHIKADLHGRTGGADCPQNRIMNSRTSVSPLSIQSYKNVTRTSQEFLSFLYLQIGFDIRFQCFFPRRGGNIFLNEVNWKWSVNSPGFKSAETTNNKKRNKLLSLHTNCSFFNSHLNWQLWNIHIKETAVYKKPTEKAYLFVFNNIAVMGGLKDSTILFPPALLFEANEFNLKTVFTEKNDRSQWKSALYCSLSNSKTLSSIFTTRDRLLM